jgi:hypothetical protein
MQPEFVISVGDLIEGYTEDKDKLTGEWDEFRRYVGQLQMPFFYVPGNHDMANRAQEKLWQEQFGRSYYHFVYRNLLFVMLNSEDPPVKGGSKVSEEQQAFVKKVAGANRDVRWTFVFIHKPLWAAAEVEKTGWLGVEKALDGRNYTVFAGHVHRYHHYVRQGMNYYQLATTGGGSKLRGLRYGEFDHLAWVTVKKDGPVIANVMLDGVLPANLEVPESTEEGKAIKDRKPTHPCTGRVTYDGKPVPNAVVVFHAYNDKTKKYARAADALAEADGSYVLSTYKAFDGVPAGEYTVTLTWREPRFDAEGKPTKNKLPEKYASAETSPLKATVREGKNDLNFELSR